MSIIENGLRADIMRKRMEDKNTLKNKGSLYVGTGNKETIETKDTYETKELSKGNSGEILICLSSDGTLEWKNEVLNVPRQGYKTEVSKIAKHTPFTGILDENSKSSFIALDSPRFYINENDRQFSTNFIIFYQLRYIEGEEDYKEYYSIIGLFDGFISGQKQVVALPIETRVTLSYTTNQNGNWYIDFSEFFKVLDSQKIYSFRCYVKYIN